MRFSKLVVASAAALSTGLTLAQDQGAGQDQQAAGDNQNGGGAGGGAGATLDPANIQSASDLTGQEPGTEGIKAGQAESQTDPFNFINFCSGKTITNGQQNVAGSCNGIPMGDIPAKDKMVSAVITNPQTGVDVDANTDFDIAVTVTGLTAGNFVNPTTEYYTAPQAVGGDGQIIGHVHVTLQDMGNTFNPTAPLDAQTFAFFKGIDDAGDGQGNLKATVTGGLPAGIYRVCTLTAAANHQPVTMPVAQRGAQDDCTKFSVGGAGGNAQGGNAAGGADNNAQGDNAAGGADNNAQGDNAAGGADNNAQGGNAAGNGATGGANTNGTAAGDPNAATGGNEGAGGAGDQNAGAAVDQGQQGGQDQQGGQQQDQQGGQQQDQQGGQQQDQQGGQQQDQQGGQDQQGQQQPDQQGGQDQQGQQQPDQQGGQDQQGQQPAGGQQEQPASTFGNFGGFRHRRVRYEGPRRSQFQSRPYAI